jgi:hypothetical protein
MPGELRDVEFLTAQGSPAGARVVWCDDPETVALTLADANGIELADNEPDARAALHRRLAALHVDDLAEWGALQTQLGTDDAARIEADAALVQRAPAVRAAAARLATAVANVELWNAEFSGCEPWPLAMARASVRDAADSIPPVDPYALADAFERVELARDRGQACDHEMRAAPPAAELVAIGSIHPEVIREAADAVQASIVAAHRAQADLEPVAGPHTEFSVDHLRHAIRLAHDRRLAASRATSRAAGAWAMAAGLLLIVHAGGWHPILDLVPAYFAVSAARTRRCATADAQLTLARAERLLGELDIDDEDALETWMQSRSAWTAARAVVAEADADLRAALVRWHALVGNHDADGTEQLIMDAALACRAVADAQMHERERVAANTELREATAALAQLEAAARAHHDAEFAQRSLAWHMARQELAAARTALLALGFTNPAHAITTIEEAGHRGALRAQIAELAAANPQVPDAPSHTVVITDTVVQPLVICVADAASGELIDLLARCRAPLSVALVTDHASTTNAAAAAGVAVVDGHTQLLVA